MFPIIISSLINTEKKNSKIIFPLKLLALLFLIVILFSIRIGGKVFKSEDNFSDRLTSLITDSSINNVYAGNCGDDCNCNCDCTFDSASCNDCNCASCDSCESCGGGDCACNCSTPDCASCDDCDDCNDCNNCSYQNCNLPPSVSIEVE